MASLTHDGGNGWRIQIGNGADRKTIRYRGTPANAELFRDRVARLVLANSNGETPNADIQQWLLDMPDVLHARLAVAALVKPRQPVGATTLGSFIDAYLAARTDIKTNTQICLKQARRNLVAFFGELKPLGAITEGDAEEYWRYLTAKVAVNTARRLSGRAKQFFRFAVRKGIIRSNPFAELESHVRSNPERRFFITREMANKVTEACPDAEWRLLFALSRWGGLRCPSEHLALTWADVDWDRNRIRVPSPKTEHIEGRAHRIIPMFPELRGPLMEVFEQAEAGTQYVITRYRAKNSNLRTQLKRIITNAKLEAWPKLFHNLRSSRQTELSETFPAHVVCAWLGNTEDVARDHYLQVTDSHFERAAKVEEKAAQNPAQYDAELACTASQNGGDTSNLPGDSAPCETVQESRWPRRESNPHVRKDNGF
jgi:integrase